MSTKNSDWQEFKRVRDEMLSGYSQAEQSSIKQQWVEKCLKPDFVHEFQFVRSKEKTEEEKSALYKEWTQMFKNGEFSPKRKTKAKVIPKKRGSTLDDLSLDDEEVEEKTESYNAQEVDEVVDQQVEQPKPKSKPKPKPKESEPMTNPSLKCPSASIMTREEMIKQLLSPSPSEGVSTEQIQLIAMETCTDLIKEVMNIAMEAAIERCELIVSDFKKAIEEDE